MKNLKYGYSGEIPSFRNFTVEKEEDCVVDLRGAENEEHGSGYFDFFCAYLPKVPFTFKRTDLQILPHLFAVCDRGAPEIRRSQRRVSVRKENIKVSSLPQRRL